MATHTLTDAELADLREVVGDDCSPPLISDERVQAWFDAADGDVCITTVSYLERLWGKARRDPKNLVTLSTGGAFNAKADGIKKQLDYYRKSCGIDDALATLTVGSIDLGIDSDWDNIEADVLNSQWWPLS